MKIEKILVITFILWILITLPMYGEEGWKPTGPKGGPIISIASIKGDKLIIGTGGSGIYISKGESVSIKPANGSEGSCVLCLTKHPVNKNIIFAGMVSNKILVSRDGGKSWQKTTHKNLIDPKDEKYLKYGTPIIHSIYRIAIHPSNSNMVYLATERNILKTEDGGKHWLDITTKKLGMDKFNEVHFKIKGKSFHLYVGTESGKIYFSPNGGKKWILRKIKIGFRNIVSLAISKSNKHFSLFAGVRNSSLGMGIYRYENEKWKMLNLPKVVFTIIKVNPLNPKHIAGLTYGGEYYDAFEVGNMGVYESFNRGNSWKRTLKDVESGSICFTYENLSRIFIGNFISSAETIGGATGEGKIYIKERGKWRIFTKSIRNHKPGFYTIEGVFSPRWNKKELFVSVTGHSMWGIKPLDKIGMYKTTDGKDWEYLTDFTPSVIKQDPLNNDLYGIDTWATSLMVSKDKGYNWNKLKLSEQSKILITDFVVLPTNPRTIIITTSENGVYLSKDCGLNFNTWNQKLKYKSVSSICYFKRKVRKNFKKKEFIIIIGTGGGGVWKRKLILE